MVAAMAVHGSDTDACPACRGLGWKLIRSRRELVIGPLTFGLVIDSVDHCGECEGTGRAR